MNFEAKSVAILGIDTYNRTPSSEVSNVPIISREVRNLCAVDSDLMTLTTGPGTYPVHQSQHGGLERS